MCAQWVAKDPSFLHADNKDSDQTGQMPRLICVFAGCTLILLVSSCRGSNVSQKFRIHVWPKLICNSKNNFLNINNSEIILVTSKDKNLELTLPEIAHRTGKLSFSLTCKMSSLFCFVQELSHKEQQITIVGFIKYCAAVEQLRRVSGDN